MKVLQDEMRSVIPLLFCLLCALPAAADFESASAAYRAKQYHEAFQAFTELAEAGDARAQTILAIMYKYGESVPIDLASAYGWYERAAVQGYPPAQNNVGVMLADGSGVEKDSEEALRWLQKALDAGYERARDKIAEVSGDQRIAMASDEPVAWSKSWNLRLPNAIRNAASAELPLEERFPEFRVQLGAMSSLAGAQKLWQQLNANRGDLFEGYQPIFEEIEQPGGSIVRLQLGPFASYRQANAFCEALKLQFGRDGCLILNVQY